MDRATLSPRLGLVRRTNERSGSLERFAAWAGRHLGHIGHERRVLQIGAALFDLSRDLHNLGPDEKWSLSAAALLHDVGRAVNPAEHPRIGAEMILSDTSLRLSLEERRRLAYLTLYHRGPVPDLARDEILRHSDGRRGLWKVLALLRAADTLDSRSIDPPDLLLFRRGREVSIHCHVRDRAEKARKAFCRPKKYRMLEEALGCTVDVEVRLGRAEMVRG